MNLYFGYGQSSGSVGDPFCQFLKLSDFEARGKPAQTFIFLDVHEDSMAGAAFQPFMPHGGVIVVPKSDTGWDQFPAARHGGSGTFSFGDGHAELHRWVDPRTRAPVTRTPLYGVRQAKNPDVWWVQDRASTQTLPIPP